MGYNEIVSIFKENGIVLQDCDLKSIQAFSFANPEVVRTNFQLLIDNNFKLAHAANHSLIIAILNSTQELQDKIDFLQSNNYQPFLRNLCFIGQLGYKKNERILVDYETGGMNL